MLLPRTCNWQERLKVANRIKNGNQLTLDGPNVIMKACIKLKSEGQSQRKRYEDVGG